MGLKLLDRVTNVTDQPDSRHVAPGGTALVERLQKLNGLIETLFASWLGSSPLVPSRRAHRVPNRQLLALTPLDDASLVPNGETRRVAAWDVSAGGLSFVHNQTLVCRTIAITFHLAPGELQSVLARLKWCRFTRNGQYRSGGEFLRTISSPQDAPLDFTLLPAG